MMRWPWRRNGVAHNHEGKELAKRQLEIAKIIEAESIESANEHRFLLYKNHFAHDIRKAMGGNQ